jgi:hypothetical protein
MTIRLDGGWATQRVAHRFARVPVGIEGVIQRFSEVLQEVKAIDHLGGLRRASAGAVARGVQAISGDDGDTSMLASPMDKRSCRTVVEPRHRLALCSGNQDRVVALALTVCPVIDPDGTPPRPCTRPDGLAGLDMMAEARGISI